MKRIVELSPDFLYPLIVWKLEKKVLILVVLLIHGSQDNNSTDPWKLRKVTKLNRMRLGEKNNPSWHKKGNNYVGKKEVETCPNVSQQPGAVIKSVNMILGCINRYITCRSHGVICLFYLVFPGLLLKSCVFFGVPYFLEIAEKLRRIWLVDTKMAKGIKCSFHEESWSLLWYFTPEEELESIK